MFSRVVFTRLGWSRVPRRDSLPAVLKGSRRVPWPSDMLPQAESPGRRVAAAPGSLGRCNRPRGRGLDRPGGDEDAGATYQPDRLSCFRCVGRPVQPGRRRVLTRLRLTPLRPWRGLPFRGLRFACRPQGDARATRGRALTYSQQCLNSSLGIPNHEARIPKQTRMSEARADPSPNHPGGRQSLGY